MILKAKWFGQNVSVLVLHRTLPPGWCKQVIQSSLQYHRGFDRLNHRSIFTSSFDVRYSMFDIFIHEPALPTGQAGCGRQVTRINTNCISLFALALNTVLLCVDTV